MRLRYFVLLLAKTADYWLQKGVSITSWLIDDNIL